MAVRGPYSFEKVRVVGPRCSAENGCRANRFSLFEMSADSNFPGNAIPPFVCRHPGDSMTAQPAQPSDLLLEAALETAAKLEEQVRQTQWMEAVSLLSAGIAHDFNNLLTVINGYNDLLLNSRELPEKSRHCLSIMRGAGERAAGLARSLMAFSRRLPIEPRMVDLNESVGELVTLTRHLLPANVELSVVAAPCLGAVLADPGGLLQVLLNLVMNSRDAMPEGGKVRIQTANFELDAASSALHPFVPPGNYILLTVSDTGIGMDDETRKRIFEPFYTTKAPGAGTGLGLPMVRHIVKQSGGFLSVQSAKGKGTTVRIYLPLAGGEKAVVAASQTALCGGMESTLIVTGDLELRSLLRDLLEGLGYAVLDAASAGEAMQLSQGLNDRLDLLVADATLPDSSGADLARRMRESRPDLSVLHLSACPEHKALGGARDSGAEFISKPFTMAAFGERVRFLLDRRKRRRVLFVDDDGAVVKFASRVLRDAGFEVLVGGDGNAALVTVGTVPLDLVITDLAMQDCEGLETIMRLRKSHPELPVIAISGAFGGDFLRTAEILGARATLPKPFSGDELLTTVRGVLGG